MLVLRTISKLISTKRLTDLNLFVAVVCTGISAVAYSTPISTQTSHEIEGHAPIISNIKEVESYLVGFKVPNGVYTVAAEKEDPNVTALRTIGKWQRFSDFEKLDSAFPLASFKDNVLYSDIDGDELESVNIITEETTLEWYKKQKTGTGIILTAFTVNDNDTPCSVQYGQDFVLRTKTTISGTSKYGVPKEVLFKNKTLESTKHVITKDIDITVSDGACYLKPLSVMAWDDNNQLTDNHLTYSPKSSRPENGGGYGVDFVPGEGYLPSTDLLGRNERKFFPTTAFAGATFEVIMPGASSDYTYEVILVDKSSSKVKGITFQGNKMTFTSEPYGNKHRILIKKNNNIVATHDFIPQKWFERLEKPRGDQGSPVQWSAIYKFDPALNENSQSRSVIHKRIAVNCPSGKRPVKFEELFSAASILDVASASPIINEDSMTLIKEFRSGGEGVFDEWGNYLNSSARENNDTKDRSEYKLKDSYGERLFSRSYHTNQVALGYTSRIETTAMNFPPELETTLGVKQFKSSDLNAFYRAEVQKFMVGVQAKIALNASKESNGVYNGWLAMQFKNVLDEETKKRIVYDGMTLAATLVATEQNGYITRHGLSAIGRDDIISVSDRYYTTSYGDDLQVGWVCVMEL